MQLIQAYLLQHTPQKSIFKPLKSHTIAYYLKQEHLGFFASFFESVPFSSPGGRHFKMAPTFTRPEKEVKTQWRSRNQAYFEKAIFIKFCNGQTTLLKVSSVKGYFN